jgi:hypothetical protein
VGGLPCRFRKTISECKRFWTFFYFGDLKSTGSKFQEIRTPSGLLGFASFIMAISVHTLRIELGDVTHAFPVLSLLDRRKKPARRKQFCLVRAAEIMLFNITSRSLGRFSSLLQSMSMEDGVLVASKTSVDAGVLTANEFDTGLDLNVNLLTLVNHAVSMLLHICAHAQYFR